jgi:hypothetical protein
MRRIAYLSTAVLYWLALPHFAGTKSAEAAVIYNQMWPAQSVGAFTSTDRMNYPKIADNFVLSDSLPTTVRSLRFIGGYLATMPPPITVPLDSLPLDDFRVSLFNDADGSPGTPILGGEFSVGVASKRFPTGGPLLNGNQFPIEYVLDLGVGISLSAGSVYWISIVNEPGLLYGWSWGRSSGVLDQHLASTEGDALTGPWAVFPVGGMSFSLNDANVPEPTSVAILVAGFLALFRVRVPIQQPRSRYA